MKRGLLLLLGLLSFASVNANDFTAPAKKTTSTNRFEEAVTFVEKGIQFHVFLNGDFEFNRLGRNSNYYNYNGRTYSNNTLRVERDYRGRIKRIDRIFIRYDYRGNVTRIGKDRKSTRLNSSHITISYAVFCLKKKQEIKIMYDAP